MAEMTIEQALGLARGHLQAGRLADLEAVCRAIFKAAPGNAEAHRLLGSGAYYAGKWPDAELLLRQAVALDPREPEYHENLSVVLFALRKFPEAETEARSALELRPGFPEAETRLGNALFELGRREEAVQAYRRALVRKPACAETENNMASALLLLNRPGEAEAACRRAIAIQPDYANAHYNLGAALQTQGRHADAVAAFRRALEINPTLAGAEIHLGNLYQTLGQREDAVAAYRRALALAPETAEAENNLAGLLESLDRLEEAEAAGRRALQIQPSLAEAACTLASALHAQGRVDEARDLYRYALEIKPNLLPFAHSKALFCEQYCPDVTPAGLAKSHARWDEQHAAGLRSTWCRFAGSPDPDRPLRVGFVSGDFGRHPVGTFLVRPLEALDRAACTVFAYSDRVHADALTARIKAACGTWRDTLALDDGGLAEQIRTDGIDILVDLAGHTAHRLQVFARKPAPVQVTWMGYVGTTGLAAIDALIADRYHVPAGAERYYRERVVRMPDDYICFDPPADAPAVGPVPALAAGQVTFGCFNNSAKVTPAVAALWAEILTRVPGSRLVLKYRWLNDTPTRRRYVELFTRHGIDPARLDFSGGVAPAELLSVYNRVDIALDPFPYSGGLTTCEALWMGVPVLTCAGETFAGRHSLSHLSNVGLGDLVARDHQDYVARAVQWAAALDWLSDLRQVLRARVAAAPLCDGPRFAAHLLAALRGLWRDWCASAQSSSQVL
jgi:predicted O-linked N-acetylglucosamine transferase (SPINDLY family)